ncbi:hypothetical protein BS78_08G023100 [Paspalum vaginatum]|nr:hypothetical protein BS78_08G023100 [Paspalum vaginatum]
MVDDDIMDCQQHVGIENSTTASAEAAAAGDAPLPSRHHGNQIIQGHQLLDVDESFIPLDRDDDEEMDSDDGDDDDDDEMVHDHRRPRLELIGTGQQVAAQLLRLRLGAVASPMHVNTTPLALGGGYANGGFGAVPASAAAVADLRKQEFRGGSRDRDAAAVGCRICLEEFEDGEEVSVVPCSRGHEFHTQCIAKWLGVSNMCPLCRHRLPTAPDGV